MTTSSTASTTDPATSLKQTHRAVWASGEYAAIAAHINERPPRDAVAAAGVQAGDRVLDVATGTGNAALVAARAGANVTGLDLVPDLLDVAKRRAEAERLHVAWVAGDAEDLPFVDGAYDRVTSVFGIQFAPRHQVVADELVRVCRPGGTIALVNWTPGGLIGQILKTLGGRLPAPPAFASPPPLWGDEDHVRELFAEHDVDLELRRATNTWAFPSAEDFQVLMEERYGPMLKARERLSGEGVWEEVRAGLLELYATFDEAIDGSFRAEAEYLVVSARRR
jgi:SAM-dependent methyltransferase